MVTVEEFVKSPSEELLLQCTKDQLLKIAEEYNVKLESSDKKLKETVYAVVRRHLFRREGEESDLRDVNFNQVRDHNGGHAAAIFCNASSVASRANF